MNTRKAPFAAGLALAFAGLAALPAAAHEHREVAGYELTVGWAEEPTYVGQLNGVSLAVAALTAASPVTATAAAEPAHSPGDAHPAEGEATPVEGLADTLQVEVTQGADTTTLPLSAVWGVPGAYVADLVPTREGTYRFRFFGTIHGTPIDETFDSADGEFDSPKPIAAIQFPPLAPAEAAAPAVEATPATASEPAATTTGGDGTQVSFLALFAGLAAIALAALALSKSRR